MNTFLTHLFRAASYLAFVAGTFWLIMYCLLGSSQIWLPLWQILSLIVIPFLILLFLQPTNSARSQAMRAGAENITNRLIHTTKQARAIVLGVLFLVGLGIFGGFLIWKAMTFQEGNDHKPQLLLP